MSGDDKAKGAAQRGADLPAELRPYLREVPNEVIRPGDDPVLDEAVAKLREMNGSDDPLFYDVRRESGGDGKRGIGNVRVYVGPAAVGGAQGRARWTRRVAIGVSAGVVIVAAAIVVAPRMWGPEVVGGSPVVEGGGVMEASAAGGAAAMIITSAPPTAASQAEVVAAPLPGSGRQEPPAVSTVSTSPRAAAAPARSGVSAKTTATPAPTSAPRATQAVAPPKPKPAAIDDDDGLIFQMPK